GEDHVLLARTGNGLGDAELLGDVQQLLRRHPLQVAQRVLREAFGDVRHRTGGLLAFVAVVVARQAIVAEALAAAALAVAAIAETVAAVAAPFALVAAALRLVLLAAVLRRWRVAAALGGGSGCWCCGGRGLRRWRAAGFVAGGSGGLGLAGTRLANALGGGFASVAPWGVGGIVGQVAISSRMRAPGTGERDGVSRRVSLEENPGMEQPGVEPGGWVRQTGGQGRANMPVHQS